MRIRFETLSNDRHLLRVAWPDRRIEEVDCEMRSCLRHDVLHDDANASDSPWPAWLSARFVEGVFERMRRLRGRWAATPFGETMERRWPPR